MKLYLDTNTWLLSTVSGGSNSTVIINAKQGSDLAIEIMPSSPLESGSLGSLVAKPKDEYGAASTSWDLAWENPATSEGGYLFKLSLNTSALAALFTGTTKAIQLMAEITIIHGEEVSKTQTFTISVAREVSTGEEGTPTELPDLKASEAEAEAGTDNSKWMTPLRTAQAIASSLDSLSYFPLGSCAYSSGGMYPATYTIKNREGTVIGHVRLTYNSNNQLTGVLITDEQETTLDHGSWTISYDESGNFVSAVPNN